MFLDNRPIVILGMQRSGTSALAGSLARLGVHLGADADFFPGDANNSEGYFEQESLTKLCHKCLAFYQLQASSVRPLSANWETYPQGALLVRELREFMLANFEYHDRWGFKQPLACLLAPLFQAAFADLELEPQYVICVRNPLEIQASEADWVYGSGVRQIAPLGKRAVGAWLNYTLGALKLVQGSPYTVVFFSRFLEEPEQFLRRIVSQRAEWTPTEGQWKDAIASVKPALRHQSASIAGCDDLPALASRLLAWCEGPTHDSNQLQEIISEWDSWQAMLAPQSLGGTRLGLAWHQGVDVKSIQEPFLPTGGWQTVRLAIDAPPRTVLNGLLYNLACRVWIRRRSFRSGSRESDFLIRPGPGSHLGELDGILRLEGAYEPRQINLVTPDFPGPYELELEVLLESGLEIANDAAGRLSSRLHQCEAKRIRMGRQ